MSEWSGIDEFIAVAGAGSFSQGAKAIGMSPTHVSRAIKMLELRVQAQLLHRTTRTVRLTDTGRVFLEQCLRISQERDEAIASIGEQGEPQGELRVTCSTAMGERFVAPIIRRFAMDHPKLRVTVDLTNRVVDLANEGYDLAIRTGSGSEGRLISRQIASRTLFTCAAPSYLRNAGAPKCVDDLAAHECVIGTSSIWHFQADRKDLVFKPSGRLRCNSGRAVIEACIAGMGICQLPDFYILPYLESGEVELLLEDANPADEPIWAVYPQRRHLVPKVQRLVERLERELGEAINNRGLP